MRPSSRVPRAFYYIANGIAVLVIAGVAVAGLYQGVRSATGQHPCEMLASTNPL